MSAGTKVMNDDPSILLHQAREQFQQGRMREVLHLTDRILAHPQCELEVDAHLLRGMACHSLRLHQEALFCLSVAIDRWNELVLVRFLLAKVLCSRGNIFVALEQYENCVWDLTEAIRLNPSESRFFLQRGTAFLGLGRTDDALLDMNVAIRLLDPADGVGRKERAFHARGVLLREMGQFDAAIADFDEMIRLNPDSGSGLRLRAETVEMRDLAIGKAGVVRGRAFVDQIVEEFRRRESGTQSRWGGLFCNDPAFRSVISQMDLLRDGTNDVLRTVQKSSDFPASYSLPLIAYLRQQVDAMVHLWCSEPTLQLHEPNFAFHSLQYSDQMKALGQAISVSSRLLERGSSLGFDLPSSDGLIVVYHLIQDCKLCQDCVVRWIIQDGGIVCQDAVDVHLQITASGFATLSEAMDFFSNLVGTEQSRGLTRRLRALCRGSTTDDPDDSDSRSSTIFTRRSSEKQLALCRLLHCLLIGGLTELPLSAQDVPHITFVPDRILFRVPFGCLLDPSTDRFLVEDRSFSVSTSLRMVKLNAEEMGKAILQRLSGDSRRCPVAGLFLGNACVLDSERLLQQSILERQTVATDVSRLRYSSEAVGCVSLVGSQFTPKRVAECFRDMMPRFVHVAAHSSPSASALNLDDDPFPEYQMTGGIQCSGDLILHAIPMTTFDLSGTELVFLNSCALADGALHEGGMMGFYRACFLAGCPSVICSLWSIFDRLSLFVASRFYKHLASGCDKARALRRSILSLMRVRVSKAASSVPRIRDIPALWAGPQLFGNRV